MFTIIIIIIIIIITPLSIIILLTLIKTAFCRQFIRVLHKTVATNTGYVSVHH